MKVIIFGLGSIGLRHYKMLKERHDFSLYYFCRDNEKNKDKYPEIKYLYSWDEVKDARIDVALISNNTDVHIDTAMKCAELGINLFIEKPLSNSLEKVHLLKEVIEKKSLKSYVAYCLRFHPVIVWLKENLVLEQVNHVRAINSSYLPLWRPSRNHKEIYSSHKNKGGGVILDSSHEIDYLVYLFGDISNIKCNSARLSDITVNSEDFLDALIEFKRSKIFCNLHLSYLSLDIRREIIIDTNNESIYGDLINNRIIIKSLDGFKEIEMKKNDMYVDQWDYFFNNKEPMNDIEESIRILRYILMFGENKNEQLS